MLSLASFVPEGQVEKLALIRAAAQRLGPALGVPAAPPPSDEEIGQALAATASLLRQVAPSSSPRVTASQAALRLASALDRLGQASPDIRAAAATAVVLPLGVMLERVRALLQAGPVTVEQLPADIVADWIARDGRARVQAFPRRELETDDGLWRFARAVQAVAPDATGVPISIRAAGDSVVAAFLQAGAWSFAAIVLILAAALRRVRDVVLTMVPVLLSGLLTFATSAVLDLPLNFANIIALPLLFGVGVAFNIYFVMAWRAGETAPLQSSLMRAVVFSALTTATAFGALWLSSHPGTASMGRLLMISLGWELLVTLLFRPALLAVPPRASVAMRAAAMKAHRWARLSIGCRGGVADAKPCRRADAAPSGGVHAAPRHRSQRDAHRHHRPGHRAHLRRLAHPARAYRRRVAYPLVQGELHLAPAGR